MTKTQRERFNQLFTDLEQLIENKVQAARADEVKGGGDPDSIPLIECELELQTLKLERHLRFMKEELR